MLHRLAFLLVVGGLLRAQPDAPPDAATQETLLAKIKQAAMRFRGQLPDFICTKLTARWEDSIRTGNKWKQRDSLEELVYFAQSGRIAIKPLKLDGRATNRTHAQVGGITEDTLLSDTIVPANVFGPSAPAQFEWSRWDRLDGRRMAVFAFKVAPFAKNYANGHAFVVGYHGLIFADPADGMVLRLEVHTDGPPDYPLRENDWDVDYAPVAISGRELVLPVKAVSRLRVSKLMLKLSSRNEIQFTNYSKYEADSTVTFGNNN